MNALEDWGRESDHAGISPFPMIPRAPCSRSLSLLKPLRRREARKPGKKQAEAEEPCAWPTRHWAQRIVIDILLI